MNNMTRNIASVLLLVLTACLTLSPATRAQELAGRPMAGTGDRALFDVDFNGGTVKNYIEAVKQASGGKLNAILDENVADLPVPEISLKHVSCNTAMSLLDNREINKFGNPEWGIIVVDKVRSGNDADEYPTYRVTVRLNNRNQYTENLVTQIFSVQAILEMGMDPDDLLSAVTIALDLQDKTQSTTVRFHEETGLLMVNGSPESVEVIAQLVNVMNDTTAFNFRSRLEDMENELEEARTYVERAEELEKENEALQFALSYNFEKWGINHQQFQEVVKQMQEEAHKQMQSEAQEQVQQLQQEKQELLAEYEELQHRVEEMQQQAGEAGEDVQHELDRRERIIQEQKRQIDELRSIVSDMRNRIAELEEQLNSDNDDNEDDDE